MKQYLKEINPKLYSYLNKDTGMFFNLTYGDYGVLGYGKAFYLKVTYQQETTYIATFCVKDDGYQRYEKAFGGRLYSNKEDIIEHSNKMIESMLE